jgi:hypothetical protein
MKKRIIAASLASIALVSAALVASPRNQTQAATAANVITADGAGEFATGATFQGIALAGGTFGIAVQTNTDTSAEGDLELQLNGSSLAGLSQWITITGWITSGTVNPDNSVSLSGTGTLDMGDGTIPAGGLPLVATITATNVQVTIGGNAVPTLPKSDGWITVE